MTKRYVCDAERCSIMEAFEEQGGRIMTINAKLDLMFPAYCYACRTPYKRTDATWINGAVRNICPACGLDQTSAEAYAIAKQRSCQ